MLLKLSLIMVWICLKFLILVSNPHNGDHLGACRALEKIGKIGCVPLKVCIFVDVSLKEIPFSMYHGNITFI